MKHKSVYQIVMIRENQVQLRCYNILFIENIGDVRMINLLIRICCLPYNISA